MPETFYSIHGTPYTGLHPAERKPSPHQAKHGYAVQPYKPKTLMSGDTVRFKNSDFDWLIEEITDENIELLRRDPTGVYRRSVSRTEEHRLHIIAQPPRWTKKPR